MTNREDNVNMAKWAEQAERYEEMVDAMKLVANEFPDLTVEERNLLSVAYKNVIGSRRAAWRIIQSIQAREDEKSSDETPSLKLKLIKEYKANIEKELKDICADILKLINDKLIKAATDSESQIFYYKMKADYYRYLAEFTEAQERKDSADNSLEAYKAATDIASTALAPTHPIRLGLALNFSVFYYEIMNSVKPACRLAKTAFDDAISELDTLSQSLYNDSCIILQLLRDNLALWSQLPGDGDGEGDGADNKEEGASDAAGGDAVEKDVSTDETAKKDETQNNEEVKEEVKTEATS